MSAVQIIERPMTDDEFSRRCAGAQEFVVERGFAIQTSEQYDIAVMDGETFVGCATGYVYNNGDAYNGWMYLYNLYLDKPYRKRGLGAQLLRTLEARVAALGITKVWTHTKSYEAPGFYQRQGYEIVCQLEQRHSTIFHEVFLRKTLTSSESSPAYSDPGDNIRFVERPLTETEIAHTDAGFDQHTCEFSCPVQHSERHGFVALDGDEFIGCISGLAYREGEKYNRWFFISDLFVEKSHHKQGLEVELLHQMEDRVLTLGGWSLTVRVASYDDRDHFLNHGYTVLYKLNDWHSHGHSLIALRKTLR